MGFGETFEGVGTTIGPTGFRPTLLFLFIRNLIFLHRLKQAQTALSSDAQRGVYLSLQIAEDFLEPGPF